VDFAADQAPVLLWSGGAVRQVFIIVHFDFMKITVNALGKSPVASWQRER
jgi:hypothetical protein